MNNSRILPIWWILFLFLFASFGIHKLFLFLFLQKLAPQIFSYSYSWEKLLFTDHWPGGWTQFLFGGSMMVIVIVLPPFNLLGCKPYSKKYILLKLETPVFFLWFRAVVAFSCLKHLLAKITTSRVIEVFLFIKSDF